VRVGLYLVAEGGHRTGVLFSGGEDPDSGTPLVSVQVASTVPELAAQAAQDIRRLAVEHNVFRGHVLSFGGDVFRHRRGAIMQFHSRPTMDSSELILDANVLAAVQRQVVDVARHKQQLLAAASTSNAAPCSMVLRVSGRLIPFAT